MALKIVIVGGVAAGASAAAKARRVNEHAEIVMFEKGPYVSFANCGLPYFVSGEISERRSLFLQTPESFWQRFRVRVEVLHEVLRIDRAARSVEVRDLKTGKVFSEAYDKLILSPGAGAILPPLPGINMKNIFTVKTVPDSDAIKDFVTKHHPRQAVIVGAGFIGLEMTEVLRHMGLEVTVIELLPQVLPPFDPDIAAFVARHLEEKGLTLVLSDGIKAFHGNGLAREVELESGHRLPMDMAILSIGVRPELKLAREAGLRIGEAGGIAVDERQRTSDPEIYAAGDATEVIHLVTGGPARIPLAGPANKQGRVAGANAAGEELTFHGTLGTAVVGSLGITAAKTGLSEREAKAAGIHAFVSLTHSLDHAGYYPGAELIHMKLVVEEGTGRLLGAQVVGEHGVDKRIDVLATAISGGLKVTDLETLDLAYAPQFSTAKDPVVMAGFVASNVLRHDVESITCEAFQERRKRPDPLQVVDVRTRPEYASGHLGGARLIPLDELRERLRELDPGQETVVYCRVGLRGYIAARVLMQNGFKRVMNLSGGILIHPEGPRPLLRSDGKTNGKVPIATLKEALGNPETEVVDVREEDEYRYEHISGSRNIPLSRLSTLVPTLPRDKDIYVFCQTGVRTVEAVWALKNEGFPRVFAVEGGMEAWRAAGYPVERRQGPIPIMRQVQIIAGSLALIGGLFVPLRWIAAVVGAGLLFAGLSGKCGMAMVLSRLPWNRFSNKGKQSNGCGPCGA